MVVDGIERLKIFCGLLLSDGEGGIGSLLSTASDKLHHVSLLSLP